MSATALKEWSAAVHAMLDGRQTVLLRKGGIGEKRFDLAAPEFVFFPTVAHGHAERVRPEHRDLLDAAASDSTEAEVVLRAGAKVVAAVAVNHPDGLRDIEQTHIWTADSIVGYLYSTSFASRAVLGNLRESFEDDLRERLSRLSAEDQFAEEIEFSIVSARAIV